MSLVEHDLKLCRQYGGGLIGMDEVGRGCLAGSVVACACYLDEDLIRANRKLLDEVNDSKQLSEKKRERLRDALYETDIPFVVRGIGPGLVDELNPLGATMRAMSQAFVDMVAEWEEDIPVDARLVLVDGSEMPKLPLDRDDQGLRIDARTVVKGDATSAAIACASIVAKVYRDSKMVALDEQDRRELGYDYNHRKHKGYGTKEHMALLYKYGPSRHHRASFEPVKTLIARASNQGR